MRMYCILKKKQQNDKSETTFRVFLYSGLNLNFILISVALEIFNMLNFCVPVL